MDKLKKKMTLLKSNLKLTFIIDIYHYRRYSYINITAIFYFILFFKHNFSIYFPITTIHIIIHHRHKITEKTKLNDTY